MPKTKNDNHTSNEKPKRSIRRREKAYCPHDCDLKGANGDPVWLVPYQDGFALIHHHHHLESSDHSVCGPTVFCCRQSAEAFIERFPESPEAISEWHETEAEQIISWIDAGVPAIYLVFCAPDKEDVLLVTGLSGDQARRTLLRELPMALFSAQSRVLAGPHPDVDELSDVRLEVTEPHIDFDIDAWKKRVQTVWEEKVEHD